MPFSYFPHSAPATLGRPGFGQAKSAWDRCRSFLQSDFYDTWRGVATLTLSNLLRYIDMYKQGGAPYLATLV